MARANVSWPTLIARAEGVLERVEGAAAAAAFPIPTGAGHRRALAQARGPRLSAGGRASACDPTRRSRRRRRPEARDRRQHAPVRRGAAGQQRAADRLARHRQVVAGQGDAREVRGKGLRLIEVDKADLVDLPDIAERVAARRERFVVFCDDLTFDAGEPGYKALKVMLDGSIAGAGGQRASIYATSNRRHLLPEYFSENLETKHIGEEVHPGESVEEKISLSERFGLWISFYPFSQDDYLAAVGGVARALRRQPATSAARGRGAHARGAAVRACSAARAAGASRGSSRKNYAGAQALEIRRAETARERADASCASPRRSSCGADGRVLLAQRPAGQAVRGLLGVSRRQARAGRIAARTRSTRELHEELGITVRRAAPWLVQEFVLSARARRAPFLPRVRVGRRARRPRRPGVRVAGAGRLHVAPLLPANTRVLRRTRAAAGVRHHVRRRQRRGVVSRPRGTRAWPAGLRSCSCATRRGRSSGARAFARDARAARASRSRRAACC